MRVASEIVLTQEQKGKLERHVRGRKTQARLKASLVLRARIVLLAAEGETDLEIAEPSRRPPAVGSTWSSASFAT
jgi:hypothetical protein